MYWYQFPGSILNATWEVFVNLVFGMSGSDISNVKTYQIGG